MKTSGVSIPTLLAISSVPPMSHTTLRNPDNTRQQHNRRSRPRHAQKSLALVRRNPNITSIFVYLVHRLDNHSRRDCRGDTEREKCKKVEHGVHKGRESPVGEQTTNRAQQSEASESDTDTVENEHNFACNFDGLDAIRDGVGPVEVCEIDARFELGLNNGCWVEME